MDAIGLSARAARRRRAGALVAVAVALVAAAGLTRHDSVPGALADTAEPFANFEGPHVHPIAITPDGTRLLAVNSPNATLSVFDLTGGAPALRAEIPVGLEPVSVAARDDREAWVVNWMSDSVSVVDLTTGNVTRTIDVGDEPADVVFAGTERERAFVTVGGERSVKVFDPADPSAAPAIVEVRGRQPRALARDASGSRVFVSVFQSGNRTTIVRSGDVKALGGPPKPSPAMSPALPKAPDVGLIVQQKGKKWVDETGKGRWKRAIPYTLADVDLVVLDASADAPKVEAEVRGVGTNVAGAAFDPEHDRLYVANSEAHNVVRFEPNLRGRFMDSRVSIVDLAAGEPAVRAADLNATVDYANSGGSDAERAESLALPGAVARAADGTLYVTAMGSAKVGVLDADGAVVARVDVGAGPTGLVADDARGRLYVLDRVDGAVSVVDTGARTELSRVPLGADPEPADVREGRRIFYDTTRSAHGTVACASCHLGGHLDGLAWDLGDPTGEMVTVTGPPLIPILFPTSHVFHPMKGPMVTQSLRGLGGTEPFHWRGDRADLDAFNPAFVTLLGAPRMLSSTELASFEAFVRSLAYPPNPREALDRTPPDPADGPSAARGRTVYLQQRTDRRVFTCNDCHTVSPEYGPGTDGLLIPGIILVGLDNAGASQDLKVPQLRGLYEKAGASFARGERIDGFGLTHDGGIDNIDTFLRTANFVFSDAGTRDDLAAFVLSLDTGTAPAVGAQITLAGGDSAERLARVETLAARADAGDCDLVVTGIVGGARAAYVYAGRGSLVDAKRGTTAALADLVRTAAPGAEVTVTGVPLGRGRALLAGAP